jgi:hypothetical protein
VVVVRQFVHQLQVQIQYFLQLHLLVVEEQEEMLHLVQFFIKVQVVVLVEVVEVHCQVDQEIHLL